MQLSLQTDYSLRTLMFLAVQPGRRRVAEIAAFFGISEGHVAKVVNHLARMGYIRSIRGVGGGIELARSPGEITIGEVVALVEGQTHLLDCVGMENVCVIERSCKLKGVLAKAERIQREYLNSVRLSDVLPFAPPVPLSTSDDSQAGKS
jgi:Rrf2 family transcriptional regulator, nitric oxide-sensitive transcriptional repressor